MPFRTALAHARLRAAVLAAVLLAASAADTWAQAVHCGTALWMKRYQAGLAPAQRGSLAARTAAAAKPVRILETANFRIQYVLRGANRVRLAAEDAAFAALADSLYAALPGTISGDAADSTVFSGLDDRGAGHPRYVSVMADLLEKARAYYVDTLKMKPPRETAAFSIYYEADVKGGKYPVDVADIGTADPFFRGQEIYALTYPTGQGGMLMENDFLFNAKVDTADGSVHGDSISSRYQGSLVHNYAREWDLGLKVTVYHELYHSVQFAYTPNENSFHLWYETSAVGMEERKAPEVDDYLQYLPAYVKDLAERGMHAFPDGGLSRYGNGIFHVFLTRELGEDFDVRLWDRLVRNGNDIVAGLEHLFASYGTTSQEIYARFGAQLAFAGTDARNPLPAFSPDIPRWPKLPRDTVRLAAAGTWVSPRAHPPLSITALHLAGSGGGKALVQPDTLLRIVLARLRSDTSTVLIRKGTTVPLDIPGSGGEAAAMLVNGHQTLRSNAAEVRQILSRVDEEVYPYPNPHRNAGGGDLIFSRLTRPALVTIYTESGAPIRALAFSTDSNLWSWDLADARGRKVRPGVYYYRTDGGPLKAFFLK